MAHKRAQQKADSRRVLIDSLRVYENDPKRVLIILQKVLDVAYVLKAKKETIPPVQQVFMTRAYQEQDYIILASEIALKTVMLSGTQTHDIATTILTTVQAIMAGYGQATGYSDETQTGRQVLLIYEQATALSQALAGQTDALSLGATLYRLDKEISNNSNYTKRN